MQCLERLVAWRGTSAGQDLPNRLRPPSIRSEEAPDTVPTVSATTASPPITWVALANRYASQTTPRDQCSAGRPSDDRSNSDRKPQVSHSTRTVGAA